MQIVSSIIARCLPIHALYETKFYEGARLEKAGDSHLGPIENGTKYFDISALSPRGQRSGLNSSASAPQIDFSLWIVYAGQLTSVPPTKLSPAIVRPASGTIRGKPMPAVECKRMASLMTSWRYVIFLTWSYVAMTPSSFALGDPSTASSSFCSLDCTTGVRAI